MLDNEQLTQKSEAMCGVFTVFAIALASIGVASANTVTQKLTGLAGQGLDINLQQPTQTVNFGIVTHGEFDTIGRIYMTAGNFAGRSGLSSTPLLFPFVLLTCILYMKGIPCDGQYLSVNLFVPLFTRIGTLYGGDGRNTFRVPDLRGRTPRCAGPNDRIGEKRGGQCEFVCFSDSNSIICLGFKSNQKKKTMSLSLMFLTKKTICLFV